MPPERVTNMRHYCQYLKGFSGSNTPTRRLFV